MTAGRFYAPDLGERERAAIEQVLTSGWLSAGPVAAEFERAVAQWTGAEAALATSSGTSAILVGLQALGVGPGDEVVTSAVTCIATVNAIASIGAVPVLADVCADTLNLDPRRVEAAVTPRTKAILPVHYAGHPVDVDLLEDVGRRHGVPLIYDAAHALGSAYHRRRIGSEPFLSAFSFSATKIITSGEGGMLVGPEDLIRRARLYASLGFDRTATDAAADWPETVLAGLKLAMCDLNAALGAAQFDRLPAFLSRRRAIADRYTEQLSGLPGVDLPVVRPGIEHSWHLYTVRIRPEILGMDRDRFVAAVRAAGGPVARQFRAAHHEPYMRERFPCAGDGLPVTETELRRNLSLPLYTKLSDAGVSDVVRAVTQVATAAAAGRVPTTDRRQSECE